MADTTVTPPGSAAVPDSAARSDATAATNVRDRQAERAKLRQLAQEFEAMLLNEMLSGWRRSLMNDDESETGGLSNATDMAASEFGRALSRSGGLGIAAVLERAFERQQDGKASAGNRADLAGGASAASAATSAPGSRGAAADAGRVARSFVQNGGEARTRSIVDVTRDALAATPVRAEGGPGTVTSPYGWRRDPFTGQSKFHAGLDVQMAYGEAVSSVATGRVSFSGNQGAYGLTVVVDHGDGLQTRFAHLSSSDVQVGDQVQRGQTIARSGRSGRATGPHLHVEVLRDGRPVDPAGLLKPSTDGADWEAYRSPSIRGLE